MEYKKFKTLLSNKEQPNVDFKLESHAFASKSEYSNAELVKDICAMANNGNVSSFLIIGVSDDVKNFKSVQNSKFTDENIQSLCKTAIYPPPKIRFIKKRWSKNVLPEHKDKDFVFRQIGPHPKQVFRLAKDFIDYKEKVCFKRNEVWVRRGTTSDLATPEEILKLFSDESVNTSEESEARKQDRIDFSNLSVSEKCSSIFGQMTKVVENDLGYKKLVWHKEPFSFQINWKQIGSTLLAINCFACDKSFAKRNLDWFYSRGIFSFEFASREGLPVEFSKNAETIKSIRRIVLWTFLDGVSQDKVMANFPSMRKSGIQYHYYLGNWRDVYKSEKYTYMPSSSEMILFDKIKSIPDFTETLTDVLVELEKANKATVFVPKIKKSRW